MAEASPTELRPMEPRPPKMRRLRRLHSLKVALKLELDMARPPGVRIEHGWSIPSAESVRDGGVSGKLHLIHTVLETGATQAHVVWFVENGESATLWTWQSGTT